MVGYIVAIGFTDSNSQSRSGDENILALGFNRGRAFGFHMPPKSSFTDTTFIR
jgi:hypothetical protein